ncbi:SUKH-3 domain-containing protein [Amycolatopsis sp. NBC_01286]|uniref:SUKH-3 domain-containing protein n=1 Tax=Amycolatopsis sp. NBC_01286 TaxID=2903560 RepID=UPI002E15FCBB|nr:SUKH-3 domain-containing protein [Amycolatopsis sp. NBC_01286]
MSIEVSDKQLAVIFSDSNWSPARVVDVEGVKVAWLRAGHVPSEAAIEFVAEFDRTTFRYPRHESIGGDQDCSLDAVEAVRSTFPIVIRSYEKRVGENLCPVGIAASRHLNLMLSSSGKMFGGYDSFLACYGGSGREAIWNIYNRVKGVPVSE